MTLIVLDTHVATKGSVVNESDLELGVDIGRGVSIENDATTSQEVLRRFQSIARKHKIPVQFQYTDFGGTNKKNYDLYMNSKGINMGVPLRNMHSAVETVDKRDLKSAEDLVYYYINS